ncbi:hypothetical protein [Ruminococcus sp.]|uniref:hypothetical protein n=1 Tax=Ruminococcus sp. TaxID=41978 RepID=UPI00258DFE22|nr:hypothetical protein [Ruminococcus sp.]MCR5021513.1 hypothetical protein [Ruminococcus sp.]
MLNIIGLIFTWIFRISLIYYVLWLYLGIHSAIFGIDSGWAAPALRNSNSPREYGRECFTSGIALGFILTVCGGWVVLLYQAVYLIARLILWVIK